MSGENTTAGAKEQPKYDPNFTQNVIQAMGEKTDPRFRQVMTALIKHVHDFAREVDLTVDEWMAGVNLINWAGQMSDNKRNEGQLVCDVIGLESLVDEITYKQTVNLGYEATATAILGPFFRTDAPLRENDSSIVTGIDDGSITYMHGVVKDTVTRKPIEDCWVDVWQASTNGLYEQQDPNQVEHNLRGKFKTDTNGYYGFYCLRPTPYPVPFDGPAGKLLQLMDRHPFRPAHIHIIAGNDKYKPLTTQIFDRNDEYLDNDSVFAVKDSLIVDFVPLKGNPKAELELTYDIFLTPTAATIAFDIVRSEKWAIDYLSCYSLKRTDNAPGMSSPPAKRQRTARACDDCKKRKKQCNGMLPCQGCLARSRPCKFSDRRAAVPASRLASSSEPPGVLPSCEKISPPKTPDPISVISGNVPKAFDGTESVIENPSRMLYDERGRLLYVGESASLSYLQAIRRLVEEHIGPSAFTNDGNRHMILEATISTPPKFQFTYALPDRETAFFLIDSFFSSLPGLVKIYNKENFLQKTINIYENPLECDTLWLSSLHLVFAIGLQLKRENPSPSPSETHILEKLQSHSGSRSELFYLSAKHLHDAVDGFEEGGLTSVQILILKTVYMLTAAKRNSAWAFLGMAVRLAYALGIHKETTFSFLPPDEQEASFLAASFGRPNAIDHKNAAYIEPDPSVVYQSEHSKFEADALLASVKISSILDEILNRIYDKRRISKSTVRSISAEFYQWKKDLPQKLQWQNISTHWKGSDAALTQLHINLIYFHGIILLMRPFLLSQVTHYLESKASATSSETQQADTFEADEDVKSFSRACIHSAVYTINAIQATFLRGALPRQDPFIVYWLFTATLIVMSGIIYPIDNGLDLDTALRSALSILQFMGEADKQARRYLYITKSARDAICQSRAEKEATSNDSGLSIFQALFREDNNPSTSNIAALGSKSGSDHASSQTPGPVAGPLQAWAADSALNDFQNPLPETNSLGFTPGYEDESIDFDTLCQPEGGFNTTLLFIHGLGSSSSFYATIIPHLVALGLSCLALDTNGSGLSKYNGSEQSIQSIAQDALDILSSLEIKLENVVVVGHSMGGIVACELASGHAFKAVVLLGPVNPNPNAASVFGKRITTVEQQGMEAMADSIPQAATGSKSTSTQHAFIRTLLLAQDAAGYISLCKVIANAQAPQYEKITCPVLIIAGLDDKSAPLEGSQLILDSCATNVAKKRLRKLEGVGHWHCIEAAPEVESLIEEFIKSLN
ncbi:hypothetical protein B7463_g9430, partial [Scytalidium lignicola]